MADEDTEIEDGYDQPDADGEPGTDGSEPSGESGADEGGTKAKSSADATGHAGDAEDDGEPEPELRTRGGTRIQTLANERNDYRDRLEQLQREIGELRRGRSVEDQSRVEREERERLALMTPEERADYRIQRMQQQTQTAIQQSEFRTSDQVDRAAYQARAISDPTFKRYEQEVERRLAEMRSQGQNIQREHLLRWIIGDRALSGAKSVQKASTAASKRVAAATVKATNSKGDTASNRGRRESTAEARLKDVLI